MRGSHKLHLISIILWGGIFLQGAHASSISSFMNKLPVPGKEAFIAKNPHDPQQKIILIPSYHLLPYSQSQITQEIRDAIDKGDVLILEDYTPGYYDFDDASALKVMLPSIYQASASVLKEMGVSRDSAFRPISGKTSWIQSPIFTQTDRNQLNKMFKPLLDTLGKQDVGYIHPAIVLIALTLLEKSRVKLYGMDVQTSLLFTGSNKPIEGLEKSPVTSLQRWRELVSNFPIDDARLRSLLTDVLLS